MATSLAAARSLSVRGVGRAAAAALGFGEAKRASAFASSPFAPAASLFAVARSSSSSLSSLSSTSYHDHHRHRQQGSDEHHHRRCRGFAAAAAAPGSVGAGPFAVPEGRHDEKDPNKPSSASGMSSQNERNRAAAAFGFLSAAWAGTAAALLFAPEATLSWGFAAAAFPADGGVSALVPLARSLGAAQLVGAAGLWALRDGAADGSAARPSYRRLYLGLAAASATGAVSALAGAEAMSGAGLVSAVAAFGSTAAALA